MSKKIMLLVAGALAVLAFTAVPAAAEPGEPEVECAGLPCGAFNISGGTAELNKTSGPSVHCFN
ncbi:MAG TPA: hypothetical protein VFT79_00260, partial [Solirubrobacterales bacterium]|nr:hypothetical protein [Solirubrobacterales bacterium]